jgi:hypothetical protein
MQRPELFFRRVYDASSDPQRRNRPENELASRNVALSSHLRRSSSYEESLIVHSRNFLMMNPYLGCRIGAARIYPRRSAPTTIVNSPSLTQTKQNQTASSSTDTKQVQDGLWIALPVLGGIDYLCLRIAPG